MNSLNHQHPSFFVNNMLEAIVLDFAPTLLSDPAALANIHTFVFAPASSLISDLELATHVYTSPSIKNDPELLSAFLHVLKGLRTLVDLHQVRNLAELEQVIDQQRQQMLQRLPFLHPSI